MMRSLIGFVGVLAASASAQTSSTPAAPPNSALPQVAIRAQAIDCGSSVIKLAPTVLEPVTNICEIINAALPIFARRDLTKVAPRIPYVEDDDRFYVPLLTTAAEGKGKPFLVPMEGVALTVSDFYSIGATGRRPKLGIALDYIKANGGKVEVAPTTISDNPRGVTRPWLAAIVSFLVRQVRGNPMKGLKKYDVVFFVAPGGDLYRTRIDHVCFNRRGTGIKDCLDAPQLW
jgi:hypothetical protein